jgi:hypothetical protein
VSQGNTNFILDKYFGINSEFEINKRISNIIEQLRKDNPYFFQPLRLILIE